MLLMVNVFYHVGAGSARPNTSTYVFVGAFGQANPAPTSDCCNLPLPTGGRFRSLQFAAPNGRTFSQPAICRSRQEDVFAACNLPLPAGGRFRSLQFAAPGGRTFSQLAICRSRREDSFAAYNLPLPTGGRFRSLQFAAPNGRTFSQLAICRSRWEDGFAACNLPLPAGGRFRSLQFRKVSIIGGCANISAGKIGFGRKIFLFCGRIVGQKQIRRSRKRGCCGFGLEFEDNIARLVVDAKKDFIQSLFY